MSGRCFICPQTEKQTLIYTLPPPHPPLIQKPLNVMSLNISSGVGGTRGCIDMAPYVTCVPPACSTLAMAAALLPPTQLSASLGAARPEAAAGLCNKQEQDQPAATAGDAAGVNKYICSI